MDQAVKYDINRTVLFGSYAKGTVDRLSDIDLMVDGKNRGGDDVFRLA
jgi:predicted nucleotidyltransferase